MESSFDGRNVEHVDATLLIDGRDRVQNGLVAVEGEVGGEPRRKVLLITGLTGPSRAVTIGRDSIRLRIELFAVLVARSESELSLTTVGGLEVGDETFVIDDFDG